MGLLTDRDHDDPLIVTADIVENAEIPDAQQLPRSNRIVLQSLATSGRLIGLVRQLLGDGIDDDLLTALLQRPEVVAGVRRKRDLEGNHPLIARRKG